MARQYKRVYSLEITGSSGSRTISELRISFEITKTLRGYPNLAKIDIYNPNQDTKSLLAERLAKIKLNAGYEENIALLFTGDIRNVTQIRKGPDEIVTLYAGDGQRSWENAIFGKTYSDKVAILQVVEDLADTFDGVAIGELSGLDKVADKLRGQTLSGSSKDILDVLADDYGFQWSIQNGEFVTVPDGQVIEEDQSSPIETAELISNTTGMIGEPTITIEGIDVSTLLNPKIIPNGAIKVESKGANVSLGNLFFLQIPSSRREGLYKVFEVIHKGDTHETEWSSSVRARFLL